MANTSLGLWFTWCEVTGPLYCFRIGPENNQNQNQNDANNANSDIINNNDGNNDGNNNENENNSIHMMDAAQEMENV